jgi:putative transposase
LICQRWSGENPSVMITLLLHLLRLLPFLCGGHRQLALENVALRQQLAVYKRTARRPKLRRSDRLFWGALSRMWTGWRDALVIVAPDTVLRWRRRRFRDHWRKISAPPTGGRPPVHPEVRALVSRMATANPLWGAPRIHGELLKLGIDVAERTVSRLMPTRRTPPSQTWRTFLTNHVPGLVSIDFFTVPTVGWRVLFVLVVLAHQRRRVLHFNVTEHPTAGWTAEQIVEAFPDDTAPPYLLRDRDTVYGPSFRQRVRGLRIREVLTAPHRPWQNPFAERLIGSVRRECLDHVLVLHERHLRRILTRYFTYYHRARTHLSLEKDAPNGRSIEPPDLGPLISIPEVGGLHHRYVRRAG